jgi:serine/threonine-protein kinase HipA
LLRRGAGWALAPAFDLNPNPDPSARRQTSIGGADHVDDEADGLMLLASVCHLDDHYARSVVAEVVSSTSTWREIALVNGVAPSEIDLFNESIDTALGRLSTLAPSD